MFSAIVRSAIALVLMLVATAPAGSAMAASKTYRGATPGAFKIIKPWKMPDIRFVDGNGATIKLSAYRGKVVLLHFWASWCHVCRTETPTVNRLAGRLKHSKLAIIALSVDRTIGAARRYLKVNRFSHLDVFFDQGMKSLRAVGVEGTPTTFLINKQGYMVGFVEGAAGWDSQAAITLLRHYINE